MVRCISCQELKHAFIRTLNLDEEHTIVPITHILFAAIGVCHECKKKKSVIPCARCRHSWPPASNWIFEVDRMEPLFASDAEYESFNSRQSRYNVRTSDLGSYEGNWYLGIDAGSTTSNPKCLSSREDGSLLYSFSANNNGSPLATTIKAIQGDFTAIFPKTETSPGHALPVYGEALIKAALMLDRRGSRNGIPCITPPLSSIPKWTVSLTSADRTWEMYQDQRRGR